LRALPVAVESLSSLATISGIIAVLVTPLVALFTHRLTLKSQRGSDMERLTGTLSQWSQDTIGSLQTQLAGAEQRCLDRITSAEQRFAAQVRAEGNRAEYWKERALKGESNNTPPPDAEDDRP
jgi:hypothetical protein